MAVLTRRRDLARPLNADEFDGDIDNLDDRITALEDDPPAATSITNITASGDQMTITLSDASTYIVTMPYRRLVPTVWSPGASLVVDNIFPYNGTLYVVIWPHTAGATFDAGANDGFGHDYYYAILPNPGNSLPDDGVLGQVLLKLSATSYHVGFRFLDAIYVEFTPSSDSDLLSDNVAGALEELEGLIASTAAGLAYDAIDISYSPSSASGLVSNNVGDALDELGERVVDFSDLSGTISPAQKRNPLVALAGSGTVSLDPALADVFYMTPSGAVTLNAASAPAGAEITLIIYTAGTSSYNVTPSTNFKSTGALATGTASGKTFTMSFVGDGTTFNEKSRTTAM